MWAEAPRPGPNSAVVTKGLVIRVAKHQTIGCACLPARQAKIPAATLRALAAPIELAREAALEEVIWACLPPIARDIWTQSPHRMYSAEAEVGQHSFLACCCSRMQPSCLLRAPCGPVLPCGTPSAAQEWHCLSVPLQPCGITSGKHVLSGQRCGRVGGHLTVSMAQGSWYAASHTSLQRQEAGHAW